MTSAGPIPALRMRGSAGLLMLLTSAVGVVAFGWPLLVSVHASTNTAHAQDAPWVFIVLLPLLLGIVLAQLAEGAMDAKAVAILGLLTACGCALRVPSPGVAGLEPVFFLLVLGGRVFGRGFGFVLGALTLAASALVTGGVGPWLPFQMLGAAWVGFGAGCLPQVRGRAELALLAGYAAVTGLLYGALLNLWFWPFITGSQTAISFAPQLGPWANLVRFVRMDVTTSLGFDIPRAVTNAVLTVALGAPILAALRRGARRAVFEPAVTFDSVSAPPT